MAMESLPSSSSSSSHRRQQSSNSDCHKYDDNYYYNRKMKTLALVLTFITYAAFHASRKPPSIVKSVLTSTWPPFDDPLHGPHRLGELDLAFLSSYSLFMFISGHLADRLSLRLFLFSSTLLSGLASLAFALGFFFKIHAFSFYLTVQIFSGIFQSAGWPCVVAVVGNWFGKSSHKKLGLLMGVWNSHTSVGNILGSVMASAVLEFGWGWSFALPGLVIIVVGLVAVYGFLVVTPPDDFQLVQIQEEEEGEEEKEEKEEKEIEIFEMSNGGTMGATTDQDPDPDPDPDPDVKAEEEEEEDVKQLINSSTAPQVERAIGFMEAWRLPGVAPYAFCLFFSKLVAYSFLYWLPFYIRHTYVAGKQLSHRTAGILSTVFDVGGVLGGVSAGFISDRLGARAFTSVIFLFFSIPALILYRQCGSISMLLNIGLMLLSGYFVNGPYSLITTAVAAELGTQDVIKSNSRALATVTAIIDGTGSVGAALGPLLTGYISTRGWNAVFVMLIISNSIAIMCLVNLVKAELRLTTR